MALDRMQFTAVLFALEKIIRRQGAKYPAYAARLKEKNFTAQIKLRDNSQGRYFVFKNGQVRSRSGIHPHPDMGMSFENAAWACRLMKPKRSHLDFINALKNFQVEAQGPDELVMWFSETLNMLVTLGADYGIDQGKGVRRHTSCTNGGPVFVYVQDGKILRITPIEFDDQDPQPWTIHARNRKFTPPRRATLDATALASKSLVYSKERLLYPMKRVDFDPNGNRNCHNRGISEYERISWDEALDLVAGEIMRVKREHGPGAIFNSSGSHHTFGNLGYFLSARLKFFNTIGFTPTMHNPDSWEGWYWGATHHWGHTMRNGGAESYGTVEDCLKNCDMVVFWSADPETTCGIYAGHEGTIRRKWLKELGIKCVHIDPYYNHTAAWMGGKWLAPRPGTDSALILAIAHVWITEELYDKDYVAARTLGFERWQSYILGNDDGIAKTPEWQEKETGVSAREVRALAREWGTSRTYLAAGGLTGFGGACRSSNGTDWARGVVCLMAMQGLGKPGVNFGCLQQGTPVDYRFFFPGYAEGGFSGDLVRTANVMNMYQRMPQLMTINSSSQVIPRLKIPEAILEGKCEGYLTDAKTIEAQFLKVRYPAPGHSEIKLYYKYGGSHFGTMVDTNRYVRMYQTDRLECVVNQSIWLEGEAKFADVILPACTGFERWDISEFASSAGVVPHSFGQCNHRVIVLQQKCIEPLGESKSDYQIFFDISKRMGLGGPYSEGSTEFDWCRRMFEASDLPHMISWEQFLKKGYFVLPAPSEELREPVAYRWYAEDRQKDVPDLAPLPGCYTGQFRHGLQTQSGKIEFESSSLKRFAPDDAERPPIMTYRESWEGPHATELYAKFPLCLVTPHPRFSFHTQYDGKDGAMIDIRDHRVLIDGYYYWIIRINSVDAVRRNIKPNDLVNVFNDRGTVICAAQVTDRVPPGTVHSYESSANYDPVGKPGASPDRGGCVNLLTPSRMMIEKSHAMACMSCLVQIEKLGAQGAIQ